MVASPESREAFDLIQDSKEQRLIVTGWDGERLATIDDRLMAAKRHGSPQAGASQPELATEPPWPGADTETCDTGACANVMPPIGEINVYGGTVDVGGRPVGKVQDGWFPCDPTPVVALPPRCVQGWTWYAMGIVILTLMSAALTWITM